LSTAPTHAAPDVLGIYGPNRAETGYDPRYAAEVGDWVVEALAEVVDGLREVRLDLPYFLEPEGDHYEETNSLGPETAPRLIEAVDRMLGYGP
jgi:hypothetical protein